MLASMWAGRTLMGVYTDILKKCYGCISVGQDPVIPAWEYVSGKFLPMTVRE